MESLEEELKNLKEELKGAEEDLSNFQELENQKYILVAIESLEESLTLSDSS